MLHSQLIPNPVSRLNTLCSYLAYFEGFGPELQAPNTFSCLQTKLQLVHLYVGGILKEL